jgi:hypothetical protein
LMSRDFCLKLLKSGCLSHYPALPWISSNFLAFPPACVHSVCTATI